MNSEIFSIMTELYILKEQSHQLSERCVIFTIFHNELNELKKQKRDDILAEKQRLNGNTDICLICKDTIIKNRKRYICPFCNILYHRFRWNKWNIINNTCPHCRR